MTLLRSTVACLLLAILAGCSAWQRHQLDRAYGPPQPVSRITTAAVTGPEYRRDIQPLLEARCTVCHGCYDAPCQLKLDAWEGLERGASKDKVYDGTRLLAANLTRLFTDAQDAAGWRAKGFTPVLNERRQAADANRQGSVLHRLLVLKQQHPLPAGAVLPASFDFTLDREQQCTTIEAFPAYARNYPLWGMPYGLPGLSAAEFDLVSRWIGDGSPVAASPPLDAAHGAAVAEWEALLNGDSAKAQLVARYLYEHLFYGNLHFSALPGRQYFRLVRSATPPGVAIREIATRRPFDDPGVARVYYRLQHDASTVLAKTHMPYALHAGRLQQWKDLFFDAPFTVTALPGYDPAIAANPFAAFEALPAKARYRFLLQDARFVIEGFIKGPVCRGQLALNVIDDRFWVVFANPEHPDAMDQGNYLAQHSDMLRLPAEQESNALPLTNWVRYAVLQREWLQAKGHYLHTHFPAVVRPGLDSIWDGDGHNANAGLTIFRHFDSASVAPGFIGPPPKTAWVIDYPLLERLHYLLVAGFDVYGNIGHQFITRTYMDFLRMEAEANFLLLLPEAVRARERAHWYREAPLHVMQFVDERWLRNTVEPAIDYRSDDPKAELFGLLQQHLTPALQQPHALQQARLDPSSLALLQSLDGLQGPFLAWLPETVFLVLQDAGHEQLFTLLRHNAYKNTSTLFAETGRRLPAEDSLGIARGLIGAYPNALYRVQQQDLPGFVDALRSLRSEADYGRFLHRYGIRRTDPQFWAASDHLHRLYRQHDGANAGLLDYNRLENR